MNLQAYLFFSFRRARESLVGIRQPKNLVSVSQPIHAFVDFTGDYVIDQMFNWPYLCLSPLPSRSHAHAGVSSKRKSKK